VFEHKNIILIVLIKLLYDSEFLIQQ